MKNESNSKILIYFVVCLVVGIILLYFLANVLGGSKSNSKETSTTYNLVLKGGNKIILEEGQKFNDPGYEVLDNTGFVVNGVATVKDDIDYNTPGKYTVSYIINGETVATREVVVQKKKEEKKFDIELVGDKEIKVLVDTLYIDKGAKATGLDGKDYTDKIKTSGKVNTNSVGKYEITYSLRIDNYSDSVKRVVNVVAADAKFKLKGDKVFELEKGTSFVDPGVVATYKDVDYSSDVKVEHKIDKNTIGEYPVTYTFKTNAFIGVIQRTVKVVEAKVDISFALLGNSEIEMYVGDKYNEPGYTAKDQNGVDYSNYVTKESTVNTGEVGVYTIKYHLIYQNVNKTLTRKVKVINKPAPKLDIDFHLNGADTIMLSLDTTFTDPGFTAQDSEFDYRDFVTISGYVNTKKVGTYTLTYTLSFENYKKTLTRTVKVRGANFQVTQSLNSAGTEVTITIKSNVENFSHYFGPSFERYNTPTITYKATMNDSYTFLVYDKYGLVDSVKVNVTSIKPVQPKDTTKPTGSCTASVKGTTTTYEVKASDSSGIKDYKHNGKTYTKNTFKVENDVEDDTVRITDKAGNYIDVTCEYKPISSGNKTLYASYSSDTLKYWTEKPNANYLVTHIWVKDAYNQMNAELNTTIGQLQTTDVMVKNTISKYGYSKKGMFAVNASGFIMSSGDSYENYVSSWRLSSRAPVIYIRGKLVRNFTQYALPKNMYPVYGMKKNGYLSYYTFNGGNTAISNNKKELEKMKSDGVRTTFSFTPVMVVNHKRVTNDSSTNLRQSLCQIDRNNFIIITNITSRSSGWNFVDMSDYMIDLNCRTGYNLDGGGSINVYYKKNNSTLNSLTKTSRPIADILYFVEK